MTRSVRKLTYCIRLRQEPEQCLYAYTLESASPLPLWPSHVLDFTPDGILAWSCPSFGAPFVREGEAMLGDGVPHEGAAYELVYARYRFSARGLRRLGMYQGPPR